MKLQIVVKFLNESATSIFSAEYSHFIYSYSQFMKKFPTYCQWNFRYPVFVTASHLTLSCHSDQGTDARQFNKDLNEAERNAWLSFKRFARTS